jgi:hypothetical protein
MNGIRRRFLIEVGLGAASFVFMVVTLLWRDWIEIVFGVDPDSQNGLFEWLVVAILAIVTVTLAVLARTDFRRLRSAAA